MLTIAERVGTPKTLYVMLIISFCLLALGSEVLLMRRSRACRALEELYEAPWLMTPISATSCTAEERYDIAHKSTRALVERCIGLLKSRFRCLSKERALFYSPPKAGLMLNACLVLHNYLIRARVPFDEIYLEDPEECGGPSSAISTQNILSIVKRQRL